jgi:hypothetical protein
MLIDPKARSMLQEEVTEIQNKMMDRAMQVFHEYENYEDVSKLEAFDTLMLIYNNYTNALIHDVLLPLDTPGDSAPLRSSEFAQLVRRLNKGYANFCYDTTRSRLNQIMEEERQKKTLNNPSHNQAEQITQSFPEEDKGDGE